jgi:pimeloyl-ACP methyl ester carboxylesterase
MNLLGHSWGANLALLYAQEFPHRVSRLVLVGPGPLSDEAKQYDEANVVRMMDPSDRQDHEEIERAYREARAVGAGVAPDTDEATIRMWVPVMFYSRSEAERFVDAYLEGGG